MNWTIQQQKAIEERGSSLLVSAAAGSGKTAVLVERIRRLVMEEGVGVDHMLVVTFTRAAAGEMKEKIYKSLSKALADNPPADQRRHLKRQLAIIGRADICTFDQFALEVVHRYYHVAALPPGIGVCDNGQGDIMRREAMDELMEARFEAQDPDFIGFLTRYCSSKNNDAAREMVADFYDFLQSLPDPDAWMDDLCSGAFNPAPFLDFAAGRVIQLLETALLYVDKAADMVKHLPDMHSKVMASRTSVEDALKAVKSDHGALSAPRTISWTRMAPKGPEKAEYGLVKDAVSTCLDVAKKLCRAKCENYLDCTEDLLRQEWDLLLPQLRILCSLTRDFTARFLEKKLAKNVLDFSDIAHQAIRILENPDVAGEYRTKFDYIFVDEYQDSNLVQDSLIQLIARPDNCFMVGDVKQSIYKFRQAEPELFLEKYNAFKEGRPVGIFDGRVIDLNHNFRSGSAVIDCVNETFEKLMTPASTGILYDEDAKLHEGVPYTGPLANSAELWIADSSDDDTIEDPEIADLRAAELEALQAVKLIRSHHLATRIKDGENPDGRLLEYRDMVILMRNMTKGEVFYQTLSNAGIPVLIERSEGYFDTMEITVFLNLLRLIDNEKQDIPLLSVLHFPAFGFSSGELAEIRAFANASGRGRVAYNIAFEDYVKNGTDAALRAKCAAFAKRLADWRLRAVYAPLEDFLWELLTSTGIDAFSASIPAGEQRRANLRALISKAKDYESRSAGGLHGFISYVEMITAKGGKVDIGQAKILSEGTDAVRIMTIHKSKGLEFPFVIIAGTSGSFNIGKAAKMRFHKDFGAAFKLVNPELSMSYTPSVFKLLSDKSRADEMAEEIRVLYVAMTRPKDIMIISGVKKDPQKAIASSVTIPGDVCSAGSYLDMLLPVTDASKVHITTRAELAALMNKVSIDKAAFEESLANGFKLEEPVEGGEAAPAKAPAASGSAVGGAPAISGSAVGGVPAISGSAVGGVPAVSGSAVGGVPAVSGSAAGGAPTISGPAPAGTPAISGSAFAGTPSISDADLRARLAFRCPAPAEGDQKRKYSVSELAELARGGEHYRPSYAKPIISTADAGTTLDSNSSDVDATLPISKSSADAIAFGDPEDEVLLPLFMQSAPALTSAEKGTAYHKVMEHIPFTAECKSSAEIQTFIAELEGRHIMTPAEAAAVDAERIAAFFTSAIGRRAVAASDTLKRESPFILRMDYQGSDILVQGTVDCCFLEDDQWILVDYKSNYVDAKHREKALERLRENYTPQLALYRRALEEITGIPVRESILYLFGIDEELHFS